MAPSLRNVYVDLGERAYDILIGDFSAAQGELGRFTAGKKVLRVADRNTAGLLALPPGWGEYVFPAGEGSKNMMQAAAICGAAARTGLDRGSLLVALGGGVTGDLTGFAAAIYMRGINFIQIPTSLLAMVDSSVGGKTGVDLPEGKNLAGAFLQPKLVLIDPALLETLPRRERIGALAEVVKYGVILDAAFFTFLEECAEILTAPRIDRAVYARLIARCCEIKAQVVVSDERETGRRALLNYGHTFGHAAELLSHFQLSHGEAVALGMRMAARLAELRGTLDAAAVERQGRLLQRLGLEIRMPANCTAAAMLEAMRHDKKTRNGQLTFVLPREIGRSEVVSGVGEDEAIQVLKEFGCR